MDFHYRLFSETLCNDSDNADDAEFKASDLHLYRLHGNMDHKVCFFPFANLCLLYNYSEVIISLAEQSYGKQFSFLRA